MHRFVLFAILSLTAIILMLPVFPQARAQEATTQSADAISSAETWHKLEQESFLFVNQYRKANKLPLLQWDDSIAKVARCHSKDMAVGDVDFGHEGFNKRVTELRTTMIGLRGAGENVLKTDDPDQVAQKAVELWLKSPHHLANIRGDFNYSGMGVWVDDQGMIYFTQIFVKTAPVVQAAPVASSPVMVTPLGFLAAPQTRAGP